WGHASRSRPLHREGRSQYVRAVGVDAEDPFTAIYRSEAERLLFMQGLQETWSLCGGRVLAAFDLSPFRVICDLGGGSGALALPGSKVTVFETPDDVVAAARAHFLPPAGEDGAEPRVRFLSGDFFRSPLPPADLYVLARAAAACVELLRRVRSALRPGGAVLRAVPGWGGADADAAAVAHDAAAGPGPRAHGGRVPGSDRTRRVLSPAAAAAMGPLPRHDGRP
ncbi:mCG57648, partial [Mus musculus]